MSTTHPPSSPPPSRGTPSSPPPLSTTASVRADAPDPDTSHKSSDELRGDIQETRSTLDQTIDALGEKLRPKNLAKDFASTLAEDGSVVAKGLFENMKRNPLPSAFIGAGLAWLLLTDADTRGPGKRLMDRLTGGSQDDDYTYDDLSGSETTYGGSGRGGSARRRRPVYTSTSRPAAMSAKPLPYEPIRDDELESIDTVYPEYRSYHESEKDAARYDVDDYSQEATDSRSRVAAAKQKAADASHAALEKAQSAGGSVAGVVKRAVAKSRDAVGHAGSSVASGAGSAASSTWDAATHAASGTWDAATHAASGTWDAATHAAADTWDATTSTASATASSVKRVAGSGVHSLTDALGQAVHYLDDTTSQLTDGATRTMKNTAHRVREGADKRPLGVAVAALAAGVVAGMIIPSTRKEDQWFGEQADHLKQKATDAAVQAKDQAKVAASAAIDSGREQGLNPSDLASKVGHVAAAAKDAAIDAASETAKEEGITPEQVKEKAARAAEEAKEKAKVKQNA